MSSGQFFTEKAEKVLNVEMKDLKIAHVITASVVAEDKGYIGRRQKRMTELGYNFEEIDITGKHEEELEELFKDKDIIFVEGGNSYYLLKQVRESGFDKVVKKFLERGDIYAGSSAGAYIACPTIEMATWHSRHNWDRFGMTDFGAMNLVPFIFRVHYTPGQDEMFREKIKQSKYDVKLLTDEQAIFVDGEDVKIVN